MDFQDVPDLLWYTGLLVSCGMLLKRTIAQRIRARQAEHWPLADGKIVYCYTDLPFGELYYSYVVSGSYFSGKFWRKEFAWRSRNEVQGRPVRVRYKPDRNDVSFLLDSDQVERLG